MIPTKQLAPKSLGNLEKQYGKEYVLEAIHQWRWPPEIQKGWKKEWTGDVKKSARSAKHDA